MSDLSEATTIAPIQPILCTIPQAATMIGRGTTFVYQAIADGKLDARKSDKRTLVVIDSLRAYVASLPPAKIKLDPRGRRRRRAA